MASYFDKYPWLHWDESQQAAYCHVCRNVRILGLKLLTSSKHGDNAFSSSGYQTWKTPTLDFNKHENSEKHRECTQKWLHHVKGTDVDTLVGNQKRKEQLANSDALRKIVDCVLFLAQQGLSLRGHNDEDGNFMRLLQLLSQDNSNLKAYLMSEKRRKFLSHDNQNEILKILSHEVLRKIVANITAVKYYSLIADETTDSSRLQQLSISLRWVDSKFIIHEDFLGLFEVDKADADHLSVMLLDVLRRFGLDIKNIRGQAYDGASVMAGIQNGVAKRISDLESRALFVHCSGHCMNLAVQEAVRCVPMVRDAIDFVKELVNFVRASPLRMHIFDSIKSSLGIEVASSTSLRPLCPTRWTVRVRSIQSVLDNYEPLMQSLTEITKSSTDESAAKANGLLKRLESFHTYAGLRLSLPVLEQAETCNTILQSSKISLADAKRAALCSADMISLMRGDNYYENLFVDCEKKAAELDIDPPTMPRTRRAPRRYDDGVPPVTFQSPKQQYHQQYVELVDHATAAIRRRFDQPGMRLACSIEQVIVLAACGMFISVFGIYLKF